MIRAHRDRHRRIFLLLALLLPALLVAALLARPDRPTIEAPIRGVEGFRETPGAGR
jgi:hypothetical protein